MVFAVIFGRLFVVQVINHDEYVAEAEKQQTMQNVIVARRGEIYMMDDGKAVPVVMNQKVWSVIIDPKIAKDSKDEIWKTLGELAADKIVAKQEDAFKNPDSRYYVIARNVDYDTAAKIKEKNLRGLWMQENNKRVYPEGQMASGLLGFVNADGVGQYGVEGALDDDLNGENGVRKTVKDVNNIPLTVGDKNVLVPAVNGKNIVLTVDRNIQNAAEKAVQSAIDELHAKHASALVMNPQTGEVLAMANMPNYDPENYGNVEDAAIYQTNATMDAFEPASVCKTFAMAAAINENKMTPDTQFNNTYCITIDGWPICNSVNWQNGIQTMQTALDYSLNIGSTQALKFLGDDANTITYQGKTRLYDYYYNHFGLGQYTGIELMESKGIIIAPEEVEGTDARYANMTFGQGLNVTMIQVASGYASIVNGGEYYTPTVVAGEVNDAGEFLQLDIEEPKRETIRPETSTTMRKMLHHARSLFADAEQYDHGAYVGGKTGTSQSYDANGAYTSDVTSATYIGFGAKTENDIPQYLIMTRVWGDGQKFDGGAHAKPIFDKISNFMLNYLRMR